MYPPMPGYGGYGYGFPPTPFEIAQANLYKHKEGTKGLVGGAALLGTGGALAGALAGAKIGSKIGRIGGTAGMAVGLVTGSVIGLLTGAIGGQKAWEVDATLEDAKDYKINGSPLMTHGGGYGGANPYGFAGVM